MSINHITPPKSIILGRSNAFRLRLRHPAMPPEYQAKTYGAQELRVDGEVEDNEGSEGNGTTGENTGGETPGGGDDNGGDNNGGGGPDSD